MGKDEANIDLAKVPILHRDVIDNGMFTLPQHTFTYVMRERVLELTILCLEGGYIYTYINNWQQFGSELFKKLETWSEQNHKTI